MSELETMNITKEDINRVIKNYSDFDKDMKIKYKKRIDI